jgi:hypothetical protein
MLFPAHNVFIFPLSTGRAVPSIRKEIIIAMRTRAAYIIIRFTPGVHRYEILLQI